MGMFDIVWFTCPKCHRELDRQSKAGDCTLGEYSALSVPEDIASDLLGKNIYCPTCEESFEVKEEKFPANRTLYLAPNE